MLIEDEAGMRLLLRKAIEKHPEFQVVAECEDFTTAILEFRKQKPEVIFLDINIHGENGIECA
ncbi:MAG TPA: DNA-binding response regulator, partial [Lachnospiraceae bacterium]|nr:DNA-binding response regulator [Lachnospiraceae bacterium]